MVNLVSNIYENCCNMMYFVSDKIFGVIDDLEQNISEELQSLRQQVQQCFTQDPPSPCSDRCNCSGPWRRVMYLNMTEPDATCPTGWQKTNYSIPTCGRVSTERLSCDSVVIPVTGGAYTRVCGSIQGYQWGVTIAFYSCVNTFSGSIQCDIDQCYVTGVSITHRHGNSTRQHIWTFASGISEPQYLTGPSNCPCDTSSFAYWQRRLPNFVRGEYFCEAGHKTAWRFHKTFHPEALWEGQGCSSGACCEYNNPPYFCKTLPEPTTDDIELRICNYHSAQFSDVAIGSIDLYVQ